MPPIAIGGEGVDAFIGPVCSGLDSVKIGIDDEPGLSVRIPKEILIEKWQDQTITDLAS